MADLTRKQAIVARILQVLEQLEANGKVRKVQRAKTLLQLAHVKPACHVVIGPEVVLSQDNRGKEIEFPLTIDLQLASNKDGYDEADALVGEVQQLIEADIQLGGLVIKIEYQGDQPYTNEVNQPEGGSMVLYNVQYRRERGNPRVGY